jgi:DNA-directed RNA polymerase specialized sigma24 family protein
LLIEIVVDIPLSESVVVQQILDCPEEGWPLFQEQFGLFITGRVALFHFSAEDRDDLLQEISFRLVRHDFKLIRQWDSNRCSFKGYLSVIIQSICRDFLRSAFYRYSQKSISLPGDEEEGGAIPDNKELFEEICTKDLDQAFIKILVAMTEVGELRAEDMVLLLLRKRGESFKEIASYLGTTEQYLLGRFHRICPRLVKRFQESGIVLGDE